MVMADRTHEDNTKENIADNSDWTFSIGTEVTRNAINPLRWRKQALFAGAKPVLADGSVREITEDDICLLYTSPSPRDRG